MTVIQEPLTHQELTALKEYEQTIEHGVTTFYEVGQALLAIRDARLYRGQYTTWQAYLDERWGFTARRAQQLIDAVEVVDNVSTIVPINNEYQARELAQYTPELQRAVAQLVIAAAPDGKLTGPRIQRAGEILAEAVRTSGMVDTGSGTSTPINAALVASEYEAMQRQRDHIKESVQKRNEKAGREVVVDYQKATVAAFTTNDHVTLHLPGIGNQLNKGEVLFITIVRKIEKG